MTPLLRWRIPPVLTPFILLILFIPLGNAEQSALDYFVDGVEAFESKNYEEAIDSFKRSVELNPSNLEFQYYIGITNAALGREKEALEIFEVIVDKDPVNFLKAFFDIAALHSKQKAFQKALQALGRAEGIDPKNPRIYLEKGYLYKNLKNYEQAIESFNRAKEVDPKLGQMVYYEMAAVYLEDEKFDLSEQIFNKAIEIDPKSALAENARLAVPNIKATKRARKPWYLTASLSWAYDDNIALDPLEGVSKPVVEGRDKGDQFQAFLLRGGYKFINRKDLEVGAGYSLSCVGYKDWVQNNILTHIPHVYLQYNSDPVFLRIQYEFSYYYTGGQPNGQDKGIYLTFGHDSDAKLRMHSIMPVITILEPYNLRSDITLNYQKKEYLDEGLTPDASHYSAGIIQSYKFSNKEWYPRVGYKFGYEDAAREDSSYRYHEGVIGFCSNMFWGVIGDFSLTYVRTSYQDFPVEGKRCDNSYIGSISLSRPFFERFHLQASYNHIRNNSNVLSDNIDPFKFRKNLYLFSVTVTF